MGGEARKSAALPKIMRTACGIETLQAGAIETADALGDPQFAPELLALARSEAATPEVRVAAVDVVGRARNVEHAAGLEAPAPAGPGPGAGAAPRGGGGLGGAGRWGAARRCRACAAWIATTRGIPRPDAGCSRTKRHARRATASAARRSSDPICPQSERSSASRRCWTPS